MLRRVALPPEVLTAATGAFLTLASIMAVGRYGAGKGLGLTIGGCVFLVLVSCFVLLPHVSVAGSIFYFAMLPTLKVFGSELLGGTKDVIAFAAASQVPADQFSLKFREVEVFAPTAAMLFQFSEVALDGRTSRVADFHQPPWTHR